MAFSASWTLVMCDFNVPARVKAFSQNLHLNLKFKPLFCSVKSSSGSILTASMTSVVWSGTGREIDKKI